MGMFGKAPGRVMGSSGQPGPFVGGLEPFFGSSEPSQTRRRYEMIDPLQNLPAERSVMQAMLFNPPYLQGRAAQLPGIPGAAPAATGTFVGAGPEQQQALAGYRAGLPLAAPAYQTGLRTIEQTAGGAFLDPMQRAEFQRMSEARQNLARQLFGETAADINARAAAQGIYGSSAREAALGRAGERISTQAAQDIAQAGFQQYGAERAAQEAAARAGAEIAPGIAGQMFRAGEAVRAPEQQARQFEAEQRQRAAEVQMRAAEVRLRGQLEAMGLDQRAVAQALDYMRLAAGEISPYITGPSPYEQSMGTLRTAASLYTGGIGSAAAGARGGGSPGGSLGWE
jgi:hypothetical protein